MNKKKITAAVAAVLVAGGTLAACSTDADIVSKNISEASENFEVTRRIIAINGITDKYLFVVEGLCSLEYPDGRTEIVCKQEDGTTVKHVVRHSDNVTLLMEQTTGTNVSTENYSVTIAPDSLLPSFKVR